ncbi:MAG: efflux RND transporter periplasmic adaptor subunit [Ignavibacteriaceae bacterium]|nr:efflux RND transporter periplasmic adaptor subunit [Ignavibacteriaceae bacterium]
MKLIKFILPLLLILIAGCGGDEPAKTTGSSYYCPMHPEVTSDRPGACPICHMDLVLTTDTEGAENMISGDFRLSKDDIIKANIITAEVKKGSISPSFNFSGKIEIPEDNIRIVSARFSGRIESLSASSTGQMLSKGSRLFTSYSDEMSRLFSEYRSLYNSGSAANQNLIKSMEDRLLLKGLTHEQITSLRSASSDIFDVTSPFGGVIVEKYISEGEYFSEGTRLFKVADLSTVWAVADVYTDALPYIKVGSAAEIKTESTGFVTRSKVSFISPVVDNASRSVKVRVALSNNGSLRANDFVTVTFTAAQKTGITVPINAVVRTGNEDIVWIQTGDETFKPRRVQLGQRTGEFYSVISGLSEGDKIVINGVYLLDSESRLRNFTGTDDSALHSGHTVANPKKKKEEKPETHNHKEKAEFLGKTNDVPFNKVCPLLGDEVAPNSPKVRYKGKIWGFCCPGCDEKFMSDPAKYSQNISADGKSYLGVYED